MVRVTEGFLMVRSHLLETQSTKRERPQAEQTGCWKRVLLMSGVRRERADRLKMWWGCFLCFCLLFWVWITQTILFLNCDVSFLQIVVKPSPDDQLVKPKTKIFLHLENNQFGLLWPEWGSQRSSSGGVRGWSPSAGRTRSEPASQRRWYSGCRSRSQCQEHRLSLRVA